MATSTQTARTAHMWSQPREPTQLIARWFATAVPALTDRTALTQLGVNFEEDSELAQSLKDGGATKSSTERLVFLSDVLSVTQLQLQTAEIKIDLNIINRIFLLDALCDQIVNALSIAHMV